MTSYYTISYYWSNPWPNSTPRSRGIDLVRVQARCSLIVSPADQVLGRAVAILTSGDPEIPIPGYLLGGPLAPDPPIDDCRPRNSPQMRGCPLEESMGSGGGTP